MTKMRVELAGMSPLAVEPYPSAGGIRMTRVSPTCMPRVPASKPVMTWPAPTVKVNRRVRYALTESSKILPVLAR